MFVFKGEPGCPLFFVFFFVCGTSEGEVWSHSLAEEKREKFLKEEEEGEVEEEKKRQEKPWELFARVCVLGGWVVRGGKEKKRNI